MPGTGSRLVWYCTLVAAVPGIPGHPQPYPTLKYLHSDCLGNPRKVMVCSASSWIDSEALYADANAGCDL